MSSENMKALVHELLDGLWNQRDMSVADRIIDPDLVPRGPMSEGMPNGPDSQKMFVGGMLQAFPDVACRIEDQEVDGDVVTTWATFAGTHTGPLMDIPATGNTVNVEVVVHSRIAGDMIVESWSEWDPDDMFRQLGIE